MANESEAGLGQTGATPTQTEDFLATEVFLDTEININGRPLVHKIQEYTPDSFLKHIRVAQAGQN